MLSHLDSADIALIVSVLSPALVVVLNNHYQARKEKREFYERHRCEVVEKYLRAVGEYVYNDNPEHRSAYGAALSEIYMYTPKSVWKCLDDMTDSLSKLHNITDLQELKDHLSYVKIQYEGLCKRLSFLSRRPSLFRKNPSDPYGEKFIRKREKEEQEEFDRFE